MDTLINNMDSREFRRGNIISARHHKNDAVQPDFFWLPIIIDAIHDDYIVTDVSQRIDLKEEFLKPELLTEEWMFKFGFKKIPHQLILQSYAIDLPLIGNKRLSASIEFGNQYMYVSEWGEDKKKPNDLICIRNSDSHGRFHVHQLQNLFFALTGEELTITE